MQVDFPKRLDMLFVREVNNVLNRRLDLRRCFDMRKVVVVLGVSHSDIVGPLRWLAVTEDDRVWHTLIQVGWRWALYPGDAPGAPGACGGLCARPCMSGKFAAGMPDPGSRIPGTPDSHQVLP